MWHKYARVSEEPAASKFRVSYTKITAVDPSEKLTSFYWTACRTVSKHLVQSLKYLITMFQITTLIWHAWSETQHSLFLVESEFLYATISARLHIWLLSKAESYDMVWHDMIYMILYGMVWYIIYGMIWYMIWYDMIWYDMTWYMIWYLLTAIGLTPGGISTVHIYKQIIHRKTQFTS